MGRALLVGADVDRRIADQGLRRIVTVRCLVTDIGV